ncbi:hypothetical protein [Brevibacillus formosus]|uniref:hypothetical protein n=1 Tax=Brevibacillus formosus TaxID=54913 RepID=UPI003F1CCED9
MDQQAPDAVTPDVPDYSSELQEIIKVMQDKAAHELVTLPSGELRIIHEATQGDIFVGVSVLALVAVLVAKWIWEALR